MTGRSPFITTTSDPQAYTPVPSAGRPGPRRDDPVLRWVCRMTDAHRAMSVASRWSEEQNMSKMVHLVWLLLLLVGCGCRGERIVFQDVLKSDCIAPCWRGVIPGSTDRQGILDLLSQPPDTDTSIPMTWSESLKWGERCVDHRYSPSQVKINLDSKDVAESIRLYTDLMLMGG